MSRKQKQKKHRGPGAAGIFGRFVSLVLLLAAAAFAGLLMFTGAVPQKMLLAAGIIMLVFVLIVFIMTRNAASKLRYIVGLLLGFLMIAVLAVGAFYIFRTMQTAKTVTSAKEEVTQVNVYVKAGQEENFEISDPEKQYGILAVLDRDNTDSAIAQIREEYSVPVETVSYQTLASLIGAVEGEEVDAIILNSAYIGVLEEMEGFADIRDRIHEAKLVSVAAKTQQPAPAKTSDEDCFAVYISGIDTHSDELLSRSRSDVNILAFVNTRTHQILLLSTPRDYYVPLSISDGQKDKLTHAGIYGVQVSMDTLSMLYGVDIDYYFRVNFTGFERIIDALGGVTVYSEQSFSVGPYTYTEGENYLYGEGALAFCRERYAFADGDNQRGRNQMAVIRGVINKMMSVDMLLHYNDVLAAVEGNFETTVPYDTISGIVKEQLDNPAGWNIVSYSVTGTGDTQVPFSMSQSAYVMIPDEESVEEAVSLVQQVLNGEVLTKQQQAEP